MSEKQNFWAPIGRVWAREITDYFPLEWWISPWSFDARKVLPPHNFLSFKHLSSEVICNYFWPGTLGLKAEANSSILLGRAFDPLFFLIHLCTHPTYIYYDLSTYLMIYINTSHCVNAWGFKTSSPVFYIHSLFQIPLLTFSLIPLSHTPSDEAFLIKIISELHVTKYLCKFSVLILLNLWQCDYFLLPKTLIACVLQDSTLIFLLPHGCFLYSLLPVISLTLKF